MTDELASVVQRVAGMPMKERIRTGKNLGEIMVVAHAVVAAERGEQVIVLIDDGDGRQMAAREAARLKRLKPDRPEVGSISLVTTVMVLQNAAGKKYLPDKSAMRGLYAKLRELDDGLLPLDLTGLMELSAWR